MSYADLIIRVAKKSNVKTSTTQRIIENLIVSIGEDLYIKGECKLLNLGTFKADSYGGTDKPVPTKQGESKLIYVEPFIIIRFKPSTVFLKKVKTGEIQYRDKKKCRDIPKVKKAKPKIMTEEEIKESRKDFLKKMKEEKESNNGKA